MVFQVLINFNYLKNKPLDVAKNKDKFHKTTVLELKTKLRDNIPGTPDLNDLRVVFGKDTLEDHRTLASYKIKHLSVLFIVMKMPGGGMTSYNIIDTYKFHEHHNLI